MNSQCRGGRLGEAEAGRTPADRSSPGRFENGRHRHRPDRAPELGPRPLGPGRIDGRLDLRVLDTRSPDPALVCVGHHDHLVLQRQPGGQPAAVAARAIGAQRRQILRHRQGQARRHRRRRQDQYGLQEPVRPLPGPQRHERPRPEGRVDRRVGHRAEPAPDALRPGHEGPAELPAAGPVQQPAGRSRENRPQAADHSRGAHRNGRLHGPDHLPGDRQRRGSRLPGAGPVLADGGADLPSPGDGGLRPVGNGRDAAHHGQRHPVHERQDAGGRPDHHLHRRVHPRPGQHHHRRRQDRHPAARARPVRPQDQGRVAGGPDLLGPDLQPSGLCRPDLGQCGGGQAGRGAATAQVPDRRRQWGPERLRRPHLADQPAERGAGGAGDGDGSGRLALRAGRRERDDAGRPDHQGPAGRRPDEVRFRRSAGLHAHPRRSRQRLWLWADGFGGRLAGGGGGQRLGRTRRDHHCL